MKTPKLTMRPGAENRDDKTKALAAVQRTDADERMNTSHVPLFPAHRQCLAIPGDPEPHQPDVYAVGQQVQPLQEPRQAARKGDFEPGRLQPVGDAPPRFLRLQQERHRKIVFPG